MKHHSDHDRLIQAWLHIWNMRCCPPDTLLVGPASPELERHFGLCPLCRQNRELLLSHPAAPSDSLSLPGDDTDGPVPGQLWAIAPHRAGWGPKSRYYAPPVVLITAAIDQDTLAVVQTCGEMLLAGQDDIPLDQGVNGFAQPWNRYTLKREQLAHCLGTVSSTCVTKILKAMEQPESSMEAGSLLWFFRHMEVETGFFFACQAQDNLPSLSSHANPEELILMPEELGDLGLVLPRDAKGLPLDELLARSMPDESLLPLAAATDDDAVQILLFSFASTGSRPGVRTVSGRLDPPRLEQATLDNGRRATVLSITGFCGELVRADALWLMRWHCEDHFVPPLPGASGAEEGVFWARFPVDHLSDPLAGILQVRIIEQHTND